MQYEEILARFQVKSRSGDKAQCLCPAHEDKEASLTVSKGSRGILLHCHAGCSLEAILEATGLKKSDLFYDNPDHYKGEKWQKFIETREGRKVENYYSYVSILTGSYAFTKVRLNPKKFLYGKIKDGRFQYGLSGFDRNKDPCIYGNLTAVRKAVEAGRTVFLCEGEKDTDTLTKQGYVAITVGSTSDIKAYGSGIVSLLRGADVIILSDNDDSGINAAHAMQAYLQVTAKSIKVVIPYPDKEHGDVTDFFEAGHTKEEFEKMCREEPLQNNRVQVKTDIMRKTKNEPLEILLRDLKAETYETTDKGFGQLFADVFRNKHRYNPSRKDWMLFDGKRWIDDVEGLSARADAKKLSDALIRYAVHIDTEGKYLKSVTALCNLRNRNNMLTDAKDVFPIQNEDLDRNDFFLNVINGTLDLTGDNPKFSEHQPDMLLSKICNAEYNPEAKCERWERFISEVMQGDVDKIKYLQKIAGISLTGDTSEETCFILYGSTTRNGKSTYIETLLYLLNDYAVTMKPETLAQKKNIDSRQASGDIARLAGCRLCNASEPPKRMIFDIALLKSLLGRDSITARHLHQREFSFIPKFKLTMNTNYLPQIADDTVFSSGRINVISFDRHLKPEERDKTLKQTLRGELSGILNWCLEGLRLYRLEGLQAPQAIRDATQAYREDSDKIGNFIRECLVKSEDNSKAKDVYESYSKWCSECGAGTESKQHFFAEMKSKGIFAAQGTVKGKTVRNVIVGYTLEEDFLENPFIR